MSKLAKAKSKRNSHSVTALMAVTTLLAIALVVPYLPYSTVYAIDTTRPGQVSGISNVTKIAAGHIHSLFLKSDGTVWTVGNNGSGQLGDNSTTDRSTVVQVVVSGGSALSNITAIAGGAAHSIALKSDGTVWTWGDNTYGELGDGSTTVCNGIALCRSVAAQVPNLSNVIGIAAGGYHNLALISGGTVKSWGRNNNGQLGDNSTTNRTTPVNVDTTSLSDATQVAAGGFHSVALRGNNSGKLKAWGKGSDGQLGNNSFTDSLLPTTMADSLGVTFTGAGFVSAGINFTTLTTVSSNRVWSTGSDGRGQQGTGCAGSTSGFVRINSLTNVSQAQAGATGEHVVAFRTDTTARGWGRNDNGQVGNGTTTDQCSPVTVVDSMGNAVTGFTSVSGGGLHSLGLKSDGTVWSWGNNVFGQLGRS